MNKIAKTATIDQKIEFIKSADQFGSVQLLIKSVGLDLSTLSEAQLDQMISNERAWAKTPLTEELIAYNFSVETTERKSCAGFVQAEIDSQGLAIPENPVWKKISLKFDTFCLSTVDEQDFVKVVCQSWIDANNLICKTSVGEKSPTTAEIEK